MDHDVLAAAGHMADVAGHMAYAAGYMAHMDGRAAEVGGIRQTDSYNGSAWLYILSNK